MMRFFRADIVLFGDIILVNRNYAPHPLAGPLQCTLSVSQSKLEGNHFKFPEDFQSNGFRSGQRITIRVSANAIRDKTAHSAFLTFLIGILSHDKSTEIDFKEFLLRNKSAKSSN